MSSLRQIEANRRNARLSTGPVTEEGKRRSRQNALRVRSCSRCSVSTAANLGKDEGWVERRTPTRRRTSRFRTERPYALCAEVAEAAPFVSLRLAP
jgi:hypothetical protein